jgi:hypothetical protein
VGFETVIPANKRLQAYAFDRAAIWLTLTPDIQLDHSKLWRKICGSISRVDCNLLMNTKIVPTPNNSKQYRFPVAFRIEYHEIKAHRVLEWESTGLVNVK